MNTKLKFLTPLMLAAALVLPAAPAFAAPQSVTVSHVVQMAKEDNTVSQAPDKCSAGKNSVSGMSNSRQLADQRWQDAASGLHQRLDNMKLLGVDTGVSSKGISRELAGGLMNSGAAIWSWTTNLVNGSVSFCAPAAVYEKIDKTAGTLGSLIVGSGGKGSMVGIFLAITFFAGLAVAYRRGRFPLGTMISKIVAAGILTAMVAGASASTLASGTYKPGLFSPGWVATSLTNTVNQIGSAPAAVLATAMSNFESNGDGQASWCDAYVGAMHDSYVDNSKSAGWQIPLTMSQMWTSTGGKTWADAQYGGSETRGFADNAWCMHLELRTGQSPFEGELFQSGIIGDLLEGGILNPTDKEKEEIKDIIDGLKEEKEETGSVSFANPVLEEMWGGKGSKAYKSASDGFKKGSLAFRAGSLEEIDKSVVAWATCQIKGGKGDHANIKDLDLSAKDSWKVREGSGSGVNAQACADWFSGANKDLKEFNWPTGNQAIEEHAAEVGASVAMVNFIKYLHGETNDASIAGGMTYVISGVILLIIFGILAVAVYVAQIALIFVSLAIVLAVILWAMPFTKNGPKSLITTLQSLIGLSLLSLLVVGLFTMISVISKTVQSLGSGLGGGAQFEAIWTGLSPVVAVIVIHVLFTKVLKKPSPFSLSGATAWAQTLSNSGGAAGLSGLGAMTSRIDRRMGDRGMQAAENRIPGFAKGRDILHKAGMTQTGSRRGAQEASDPDRRANKLGGGLTSPNTPAGAGAGADGAMPGNGSGAGKPGAQGSEAPRPGSDTAGAEEAREGHSLLNGLMAGQSTDDNGNPLRSAEADPDAGMKLSEGLDPAEAAENARQVELESAMGISAIEEKNASRAAQRASNFEGFSADDAAVGRNLLDNTHRLGLDNSEMEDAAVGSKQKAIAKKVAKIEREEAAKWAKENADQLKQERKDGKLERKERLKSGINPETGEEYTFLEKHSMLNKSVDLMATPWNDLKKKPTRTIARNAAIGAVATVTLAAVAPAAVLAAPLVAAYGPRALAAAKSRGETVRSAAWEQVALRTTGGRDAAVNRYREHLRTETAQDAMKVASMKERQKAAQGYRAAAERATLQSAGSQPSAPTGQNTAPSKTGNAQQAPQRSGSERPAVTSRPDGQNPATPRPQSTQGPAPKSAPAAVQPPAPTSKPSGARTEQAQPAAQKPVGQPKSTGQETGFVRAPQQAPAGGRPNAPQNSGRPRGEQTAPGNGIRGQQTNRPQGGFGPGTGGGRPV